jgi:hypothetical protein
MNTTTELAALLASPLTTHRFDSGPLTHQPEGVPAPYTYQHFNLALGEVILGHIAGDSRGRQTPGYPCPSLVEAEAIRAEIIRRWNAFPALLNGCKAFIAAEDSFRANTGMPYPSGEGDDMTEAYGVVTAAITQAEAGK